MQQPGAASIFNADFFTKRFPLLYDNFVYLILFIARSIFSAVDALKSKSSMVAVNVASLLSHWIWVTTFLFSLKVLTISPSGVLKLSGEIALATASAVFSFAYSSVIVASNLLALQLFPNKFIHSLNKILDLI